MRKISLYNCWKHLTVVLRHKYHVYYICSKCNMRRVGLLHDLSKLSPLEFFKGVEYFTGVSSPVEEEKKELGYSLSWLNHRSKNKHHWQYWIDNRGREMIPVPIPDKYVAEMVCDWYGAGRAYNNSTSYKDVSSWYKENGDKMLLHGSTRTVIKWILCSYDEKELFRRIGVVYHH